MENQRLSLEEFKALFQDDFESREELLKGYESFLSTFEQLDRAAVPELSAMQKAEVFRQSWRARPKESPLLLTLFNYLRQPAFTFVLGIMIGCIVMSVVTNNGIELAPTASAKEPLEIERTRYSQTYRGKIIDDFYAEFEDPEIVDERAGEAAPWQTTLRGTLDDGEIYVVLNL